MASEAVIADFAHRRLKRVPERHPSCGKDPDPLLAVAPLARN